MENKKIVNNKKEDYYPFSDSLVKKITSSAEKADDIIEDYLRDRYALVTDLTDGEKVFVHKISLSVSGKGRSKTYSIDATPTKEIELEKDKLIRIRKNSWHGLDDIANLRTNNNFYNIMFVDRTLTTVRKVRLKLNKGKRDE